MAWLLPTVTAVLAVLVAGLAVLVVRTQRRLAGLERRLEERRPAAGVAEVRSSPAAQPATGEAPAEAADARPEFVITRIGEPEPEPEPVATVPAPVFADLLLKESVVQTASLFHGLRRALAPETRNRIRFHMRQEVRRSRKQRKAELREVRREWAARQRQSMAGETAA